MDAASMTAIANLVTQAAGTVSSASAQQTAGEAKNRAAQLQAAGVTYRGETAATIDEYRAGLTEWSAETNRNFALARASQIETTADAQAAQTKANAAAQADIINRSTARTMGRATAAYGASGVAGGSSLYVLNDIATEGELQSNLTIYGGKVQADWLQYGAQVQAANIRQQSAIDTQTAESQAVIYRTMATAERTNASIGAAALVAGGAVAQDAANMAAGTTLLTGLGKVATSAGDLLDKGSSSNTTPTGATATAASAAATRLPSGVTGQTTGQGSSF
jgi:hypothetical protein